MNETNVKQAEADRMVRAQRDWARARVSAVLEDFDEHVREIKNVRLRKDILSTLIGVGIALFRESATQKEINPHLTEMVASLEMLEEDSDEEMAEAVMMNGTGDLPS